MREGRMRINLDVSQELGEKVKAAAKKKDIAINGFIRLALEEYLLKIGE